MRRKRGHERHPMRNALVLDRLDDRNNDDNENNNDRDTDDDAHLI